MPHAEEKGQAKTFAAKHVLQACFAISIDSWLK
jgi:hypothetical protein